MTLPDRPAIPLDRVDAVVFDTDGVLTDTASVHSAAWKRLFDESLASRSAPSRSSTTSATWTASPATTASPASSPPAASPCRGETRPTHPATRRSAGSATARTATSSRTSASTACKLGANGVRTAVVSASRNMRAVLDAAGIRQLFDVEVDGVDAARLGLPGKPDPALFLEAASRLEVTPPRAAVVEDALAGVEAGRRGGFGMVVGVDRAGQAAELAARGADVVVDDLGQLGLDGGLGREGGG